MVIFHSAMSHLYPLNPKFLLVLVICYLFVRIYLINKLLFAVSHWLRFRTYLQKCCPSETASLLLKCFRPRNEHAYELHDKDPEMVLRLDQKRNEEITLASDLSAVGCH